MYEGINLDYSTIHKFYNTVSNPCLVKLFKHSYSVLKLIKSINYIKLMKEINNENDYSSSDGSDREDYKSLKIKNKKKANIGQTLTELIENTTSNFLIIQKRILYQLRINYYSRNWIKILNYRMN